MNRMQIPKHEAKAKSASADCSIVVKQKQIPTGTELPSSNDNISVPIGLVKTVEHYLGSAGILDFADTFKRRGVPMSRILVAMYTHILMGSNSMNRCSDWLKNRDVRKELGLD